MEFIAIFSPVVQENATHRRDPLIDGEESAGASNTVIRFHGVSLDGARQRLGDLPIVRSGLASVQVFPLVSLVPEDAVLAPN